MNNNKYEYEILFDKLEEAKKEYIRSDNFNLEMSQEITNEINKLKQIYDQSEETAIIFTRAR